MSLWVNSKYKDKAEREKDEAIANHELYVRLKSQGLEYGKVVLYMNLGNREKALMQRITRCSDRELCGGRLRTTVLANKRYAVMS